ncbi:MAG: DUF2807 domain-containing protein [Alphaproteobacteria bacterium]
MKRVLGFIAALSFMAPAGAMASTKTFTVQPFASISVAAGIALKVEVGPPQSIVAETDGDFSDLVIEARGGDLFIGRPPRWFSFGWDRGPDYKVTVTVPALHGLETSSSAVADVSGSITGNAEIAASSSGRANVSEIQGGSVSLAVSSSGDIEIASLQASSMEAHAASSGHAKVAQLRAGTVEVHASSSGVVEASGSCTTLTAEASSSGHILAGKLECATLLAQVSSSGGVEGFASKSFEGRASSGGSVTVGGKPAQVQKDESSGGVIDVRN